jgi:serine protease Pab87-like protein
LPQISADDTDRKERLVFIRVNPRLKNLSLVFPEDLDAPRPRFFTMSEGSRFEVEFRRTGDEIEFLFERYKFRRGGPLK